MKNSGFFGIKVDADAASYIARVIATGVTLTGAEKGAINLFVVQLKHYSLWPKITDAGIFIGGTAAAHSETLKGVFDITWAGTVTHDAMGSVGDGSTGYGTLGFNANTLTINDSHISIYSQTNNTTSATDISALNTTTSRFQIILYSAGNTISDHNSSTVGAGRVSVANANTSGIYISTRVSSTDFRLIKNGSQIGSTAATTNNGTFPAVGMVIMCLNTNGTKSLFSNRKLSYSDYGTGLTLAECAIHSTLVNNLQKALGRNTY